MPTSKGVIQGYDGVAMVDGKHQIIVHAEAFGEGQEHGVFIPMLEGTREHFEALAWRQDIFATPTVLADAGFCSEANTRYLAEQQIHRGFDVPQARPAVQAGGAPQAHAGVGTTCEAEEGVVVSAEGLSAGAGSLALHLSGGEALV